MENSTRKLSDLLALIKYPLLTEKSINLYNDRQYTFIVDRSLTKDEIKFVIEKIFNVKIYLYKTPGLSHELLHVFMLFNTALADQISI